MGATAGDVIEQAFRELNIVAVGAAPTATEIADALPRLDALVASLMGYELGSPLRLWHLPDEWSSSQDPRHPLTPENLEDTTTEPWLYPPPNVRLVAKITTAQTVYLPANPPEGARVAFINGGATANPTLNASGLLIEGAATVTDTPANLDGVTWFFREDLGNWLRLEPIAAEADEMPLPEKFNDLFVCGLALRIARRYGVAVPEDVAQRYADMLQRAVDCYRAGGAPLSPAELRTLLRTTP